MQESSGIETEILKRLFRDSIMHLLCIHFCEMGLRRLESISFFDRVRSFCGIFLEPIVDKNEDHLEEGGISLSLKLTCLRRFSFDCCREVGTSDYMLHVVIKFPDRRTETFNFLIINQDISQEELLTIFLKKFNNRYHETTGIYTFPSSDTAA